MSEAIKVSVIIPVYNAQKHLRQCLDSVCGQTLREIEILCVDDGSTDDSPAILADYAARDPRLRVIRQENSGAAAARNAGLAQAAGDYLVFWDADDFFDRTALEKMARQCGEDGAEICVCGGSTFLDDTGEEIPSGVYLKSSLLPRKRPFNIQDMPEHILDFTTGTVWNKMFSRAFVEEHGLRFPDTKACEDANYVAKALCLAERITVVREPLICYRTTQRGSLSFGWSKDVEDPIRAWIEAAETLRALDSFPERSFSNKALSVMLGMLRKCCGSWDAFREAAEILKGGALEKMGVVEREKGWYYEAWKAECLEHLLHDTPENFLCFYLYITYNRLRKASGSSRAIRNSRDYRVGKTLLWLPKKLKRLFRG